MRNIVFGDTGGWLPQLLRAFDQLGINAEEFTIPKDIRVLHLGDLIHKGAYSRQLLVLITNLMLNNPGQWIQLMGNHEAQHLPGAPTFWPCGCNYDDANLLNVLHSEGLLKPTHGISDARPLRIAGLPHLDQDSTSMFFSHGGLTQGFWQVGAQAQADPVKVSEALNALSIPEITVPGLMLGECRDPNEVGPVWAIGNTEVYSSWRQAGTPMPFAQLHGHTTSYSYDRQAWWPNLEDFRKSVTLLPGSRGVASELNNNLMLGLDPGFSEYEPAIAMQPWFEFETDL